MNNECGIPHFCIQLDLIGKKFADNCLFASIYNSSKSLFLSNFGSARRAVSNISYHLILTLCIWVQITVFLYLYSIWIWTHKIHFRQRKMKIKAQLSQLEISMDFRQFNQLNHQKIKHCAIYARLANALLTIAFSFFLNRQNRPALWHGDLGDTHAPKRHDRVSDQLDAVGFSLGKCRGWLRSNGRRQPIQQSMKNISMSLWSPDWGIGLGQRTCFWHTIGCLKRLRYRTNATD